MTLSRLAAAFDHLYDERRMAFLERLVVWVSIAGFVVHLGLVFLASNLHSPPPLIASAGTNYLAAIYTPFSYILFYEVLMLIVALPQSTTRSIAKQYEIVSLIFVRNFFHAIAELQGIGKITNLSPDVVPVFGNLSAGLLMFLLVTIFLHAAKSGEKAAPLTESAEVAALVTRKKIIALGLTILLAALAVRSVIEYLMDIFNVIYRNATPGADSSGSFYTQVFMVMIFTDVVIVILSLVVSDRYELVFRNAAFVISTILIRFSLTAGWPYGALLALMGMTFGILTLLIYNYHRRINDH
jgi:hypothetical protein